MKFVTQNNTTWAFCVLVKALSNDKHRINLKQKFPRDITRLRQEALFYEPGSFRFEYRTN